ncbi:epoxide hydrolase 4 isoform X2 [Leptinotarsa decemlineata]|uniref:epoxide hydrolase 4 isoform X2 n=1 Tax=Leptinotarsa decemlineata TaxID=7539 RepID=UPI003D30A113
MAKEFRIQTISVCDTIRIHCLSCIFGVWVIFKRLAKGVWNSQRLTNIQPRDNPPSCLVDSRLGQHKYVKLKVWRSRYQINRILEEIKDFIHALGVSNCIIIGHDLGALIGWYLVHQTPELVNKFFAVSCPHPNIYWQNLSNTCNYQWLNFVQVPYLPEIDALKEDVKIIDQYYKHLAPNDVYLEAYKYAFSRKDDWTGPINYYRKLPFLRINEGAGNISTTVILITGNKDQLVKLEGIVKSTEYCDKFYLKMIDGTEHFPHQEDPENFNKVIIQFLIGKSTSVEKDMLQRSSSKRIMQGLLGAVSTTVKYGNSVIDNVQKKTNCVVSSIPIGLSLNYNQATSK